MNIYKQFNKWKQNRKPQRLQRLDRNYVCAILRLVVSSGFLTVLVPPNCLLQRQTSPSWKEKSFQCYCFTWTPSLVLSFGLSRVFSTNWKQWQSQISQLMQFPAEEQRQRQMKWSETGLGHIWTTSWFLPLRNLFPSLPNKTFGYVWGPRCCLRASPSRTGGWPCSEAHKPIPPCLSR